MSSELEEYLTPVARISTIRHEQSKPIISIIDRQKTNGEGDRIVRRESN